MNKKEKPVILPNECSLLRWIACVLVGLALGTVILIPYSIAIVLLVDPNADAIFGLPMETLHLLASFAGLFVGMVISLRVVAKTSMRDFILGINGKFDRKQALIILALFLLGFFLPYLILHGNVRPRGVSFSDFVPYFLLMLLLTWMQTSLEEIIFRGVVLRYACKNEVAFTKKSVILAVISSLVFMAAHLSNPEVLTQSGIQIAAAALSYLVSGLALFFANMHFKSLVPGLVIHWINNLLTFTLISSVVSAGNTPSLLVDHTPPLGSNYLFVALFNYLPLFVYIFIDHRRKKEAKAA